MSRRARDFYLVILVAVLVNSVLWLDSFDRYLNGRYHIYLSQYLPESAFTPARVLREAIASNDDAAQSLSVIPVAYADKIAISEVAAPIQPPVAASAPTSGEEDKLVASSAPNESQSVALKADIKEQPPTHPDGSAPQQELAVADTAPKILFAGDSMMQGVAPIVIRRMRKDYPGGVFVDLSKPSTGLTARRYFDWPAKIKEESIKHGIQVIVMFLGPNDPWDIYEGKKRYAFPSESWEDKYRSRVDEVLDFAAANGIRVIWIGLPVMREERIQRGAKIENRIFQGEAEKYKFDYLPTENFLGRLDDPYTKYIDDPKKGKLAVRLDDGVHFTMLGLRMISSRVDELLRKRQPL